MRYVRCPAGGVFSSAAASAGGEAHQFINKRYRTRSPQLKQVKSVGKRPGRGDGGGGLAYDVINDITTRVKQL